MDSWPKGRLSELGEGECREVLGTHSVGRVAWCSATGPHVVPVNFVMTADRLWIRSTAYSQLAQDSRDQPVAFEVDDLDDFTRSGTSVVVQGTARHEDPAALRGLHLDLDPWPEGSRSLLISIGIEEISGRRLLPS